MPIENLEREFLNPSSPYRAKPFWAWNNQLEETELRRQIRIFKEMGFGGFFHAFQNWFENQIHW